MSVNTRRPNESTAVRPTYFPLGTDERGASHVRDVATGTVHIVHADASRERKLVPDGRLDEYVTAVADAYGWRRRKYARDLGDLLFDVAGLEGTDR